ncbi:MAG: RDD family protein, partial [Oleiharenicola lentus]
MFTILGADGKEYGPVSEAKIAEWIAAGRANLQTKARRAGETDWKTLGDFPEFIAPGVPAAVPPAVPAAIVAPALPPAAAGDVRELASPWARLGATVLDSIIGGVFVALGFVMLLLTGIFSNPNSPNPAMLLAGGVTLCLALLLLIVIQIYLLVTRGQTMGKKLLGIRIVTFDDETNPGFVKVFLLRVFVNGLIGAVPGIGIVYTLVDLLF